MNAEHAAFADATVGGIHKPGGCAVLGIEDGTATVIEDGTVVGHGIIWDNTEALWCCTAAAGASTTGDWTILQMNPNTQWKGGDVTWAGNHQFDASVDFSGVDITGDLYVDSSADFSAVYIEGDIQLTSCITNSGGYLDENDLGSDSTAAVASQQSIKSYVDTILDPTVEAGAAGSTGETIFNNGLRIARGVSDVASNNSTSITLAGWSQIYAAVASWDNTTTNDSNDCKSVDFSTTHFRILNTSGVDLTAAWIAIGR